ncbi:tyrosinase [Aspergillus bombycis]|uniref:Tyrosinase n=1 Tax=Aspergillus bombycis TaxID=109264 RepID=A0A1F7ZXX7_9EURO|nr:tyrosinase [Aspergillus bombycis]OGM44332.1 tyrosinase [Aspergillus bombycis]
MVALQALSRYCYSAYHASSSTAVASSQLDQLADFAYNVTTDSVTGGSESKRGGCTLQNLRIRRDWRTFSKTQKKDYINSVLCLQKLPSRTPAHLAPGARTRYDDFVATHINQTQIIHYTGTFLAWHRYFIYEFEQALRDECSYTGDYPYWNWGADADNMEKSQVFDGSETSLSGNGEYIPNQEDIKLLLGNYPAIDLPPGSGGGCVTSGPFKDYKLNLGPAALSLPGGNMTAAANPLTYNPRCLKRSLTTEILQRYNTFPKIVELILDNNDVWDFQMTMQGIPGSGSIGVHGGGHYSMGGDPGRDVYVSPGDVAFWLHHGMIDRVWWIWQNLDLQKRQNAISGTGTFMNNPASPNTTLDTVIDIGYANGEPIAMRDIMSTTAGPFCYVYL